MLLGPVSPEDLAPEHRPYRPLGAALQLLRCRDPEVLISGPANTGKSRACLEKLHLAASRYAGMRGLILRKTRESLTESALVTFEDKVVPAGHPILRGAKRNARRAYYYPNGSIIVVGGFKQSGLDQQQKIMSTDYDLIFAQEAIELTENEWERALTRLRNGVMPYQQLIADTNPDAPTHWLKRRCDSGKTKMLLSRHEDNPTVTAEYLAKLESLTGTRYQRLRLGRWVQSEGVVYEGWDAALHLIERFEIPWTWPRYWSVDFGYTNPFVCQFWAVDPDGRLYRYREIYQSKRLVEDHAEAMLRILQEECSLVRRANPHMTDAQIRSSLAPRAIVCDHDAEDRATLERHLHMSTVQAKKDLSPGIQGVAARLRVAGDRKPRLFLLRNSVLERDPVLDEDKRPQCTEEEIDAYVWDLGSGRKKGEVPLDKDNHGMDAMRYVVARLDEQPSILFCQPPRAMYVPLRVNPYSW